VYFLRYFVLLKTENMKPIPALIFVALIVAMSACKKDNGYMGTIKLIPAIIGPPCVPNLDAIWQGSMTADSFTSVSNTPASLGLDGNTVYPVYMKINWITHTPSCSGLITVTSYQKL
jgi:hypothetical protein